MHRNDRLVGMGARRVSKIATRRSRRIALAAAVALIACSVPFTGHSTPTEPLSVAAACGVCPTPEVLNCAPDQQWDPGTTDTTGGFVGQEVPMGCPNPVGDAEAVVAEVGPASNDPVGAITAAAGAGLVAVPGPTSVAQFVADQAPSVPDPNDPCFNPANCMTVDNNNWRYSYAAVEWCRQGYGGCDAWKIWLKGEVKWNQYSVWGVYVDCSDHSSNVGYSLSISWCGYWNNGATWSTSPNFMDLGENWDVFCCSGSSWGASQGYWTRIDVEPNSAHNFRGGGPD